MENLKINITKALELLLIEKYFSEFEIIDGLSQHPNGINFYQWLFCKSLITKEELERINIELNREEGEK